MARPIDLSTQKGRNSYAKGTGGKSTIEKKKRYIIVGDNNFWYSTTGEITQKQLEIEIKFVKRAIKDKMYDQNDATELSVYEASFVKTVKTRAKL